MSKSKQFLPRRGKNPAALEASLIKSREAMVHSMSALENLTKMTTENCRILGQLVVMFEILKDKGIVTNEEIINKFKDLEAKQKAEEERKEAEAKRELDAERQRLADESNGRVQDPKPEAEPNASSSDAEGSTVQPEETGNNENSGRNEGLKLL